MATYAMPAYDEKEYRQGIDTSYYTNAANQYEQEQNQNRANQIAEAQKAQTSALKNAYITRLQNERNMNQNLAMAGIRGGATETSNLRLANQYGTAVNAANTDYSNSVNQINQTIDQNIRDYKADMASKAEEYLQNQSNARWQAAREDQANRYTMQREDANNKYERKQAKIAQQTEYWSTYYTNLYSGWSDKKAKKELKNIEKKIKNAKTATEKIRWQQAKSALGARRGVIANK